MAAISNIILCASKDVRAKLTQAGIATDGLLSARRYRCRITTVTKTAKMQTQVTNKKYIPIDIWCGLIACYHAT